MSDRTRTALLIPGRRFGPHMPLLMFARMAAEARGARVDGVTWVGEEELAGLPASRLGEWVGSQVEPCLSGRPLLVGKSLGCYAARVAGRRALPAVWYTPVLTDPSIADMLRAATAPFLLIGGSADDLWDGTLARALSPHVLEIEGAGHGLTVPGPVSRSAEILGRSGTRIEEFLDAVVWRVE